MATITKTKTSKGKVRYRMRVVVGHKPDGTPIQRMRTFDTSREAVTAAKSWETDRDRGVGGEVSKLRMGDYVRSWLERAAKRVRPSTLYGWQYMVDHHIMPALGGLLLREVTAARVQAWIDKIVSRDTARRARRILYTCLEDAVRLNMLPANPVARVIAPPPPRPVGTAWSKEEARAFLTAAAGYVYHPYWLLAVRLALRPSELLGLRWQAVDLDAGTLSVEEGRATVRNSAFEGGTKSAAGQRKLDLPADVVGVLKAHKVAQNRLRLKVGPAWEDHNLVCAGEEGQFIRHNNLTRAFKRLCKLSGVKAIRLYDLRHTAISLMAEAGADFKAISEVAGHANVRITRNVYQHINRSQRAAALEALSEALEPESAPEAQSVSS